MSLTKEEAERLGNKLLKKMKGKGWKLRVHENLGWWFNVYNKNLSVSSNDCYKQKKSEKTYYSCLMDDNPERHWGGSFIWTERSGKGYRTDPNKAVEYQVKLARKIVDKLNKAVEAAEKIISQFFDRFDSTVVQMEDTEKRH